MAEPSSAPMRHHPLVELPVAPGPANPAPADYRGDPKSRYTSVERDPPRVHARKDFSKMPDLDQTSRVGRSAVADKPRYNVRNTDEVDGVCRNLNSIVEEIISTEGLFAGGAPRHAFVTFATPDYHWGLVAWLRSLRRVSDKPVFLLVAREMSPPTEISGVYMIVVPGLYDDRSLLKRPEFRDMLSKLWVFSLSALDRVFYADADCIFLKSSDELFERPGFLVCPDYVESRQEDKFNAGLMVFSPTEALRQRVFRHVAEASSRDGGDQVLLNELLRNDVSIIDEKYNLLRHFHYFSNGSSNKDIRVIHYIVKKPWTLQYKEIPDAMLVDLDDLWTSFLSPDERSQLIGEWRRSIFYISERQRFENVAPPAPQLSDIVATLDDRIRNLEERLKVRMRRLRVAVIAEIIALLLLILFISFKLLR